MTSIDNPLPVDRDTLFLLGSVRKTYTATVLMRLVAEGRAELDAPVSRYVPEFLREADDVHAVGHGGSANGQFAELLTVPERGFAVAVMSNAGPDGIPCNQTIVCWALQTYLGVADRDPEPLPYDGAGPWSSSDATRTTSSARTGQG
ncbi:serine hydrolase [Streptosporangium sp. NPDC000396]|uniref:serine hydrolase n=1 Tax=Streptosporangium sp. NPDC000396 TaxID=3366185 RepID=UPI003690C783